MRRQSRRSHRTEPPDRPLRSAVRLHLLVGVSAGKRGQSPSPDRSRRCRQAPRITRPSETDSRPGPTPEDHRPAPNASARDPQPHQRGSSPATPKRSPTPIQGHQHRCERHNTDHVHQRSRKRDRHQIAGSYITGLTAPLDPTKPTTVDIPRLIAPSLRHPPMTKLMRRNPQPPRTQGARDLRWTRIAVGLDTAIISDALCISKQKAL